MICKQFVSNTKSRKKLKPCRGFKSFRLLVFHIQFLKNRVFDSSNPSPRRKIENGSMEIRKKLGAKKAEKSLEISAFLVFSRSNLNRPKDLAGAQGRSGHRRRAAMLDFPLREKSSSPCRSPYAKEKTADGGFSFGRGTKARTLDTRFWRAVSSFWKYYLVSSSIIADKHDKCNKIF